MNDNKKSQSYISPGKYILKTIIKVEILLTFMIYPTSLLLGTEGIQNIKLYIILYCLGLVLATFGALVNYNQFVKPLNFLSEYIERLGKDDLTFRIDTAVASGHKQLFEQFNQTTDKLAKMIINIKQSAEIVSKSANEISAGNEDLSQRSQQQATSLEDTSSTIDELTATVKQNADNAQKANKMSEQTVEGVKKGEDVLKQTIGAMEEVNTSSKKISEIINVVNEIAFQTNLLALNAAVEAARAGDQGRGFAVVASEVRNLAGRSAKAAKEIQSLINDSVEKIENGNKLVLKTGDNLDKISESVMNMSELVSEISAASHEQSAGIEEVNKAIMQIDQVTQQNVSLVERVSASSQLMNNQSEQLYHLASQFKVSDSI